jgi:hypothetical protein
LAGTTLAITQKKLELRLRALEANGAELPNLELSRQKAGSMLTEMKDLTAKQASLAAAKQEVSKRLAQLNNEGQKLVTFLDVAVRQQYGNRAEKLVEFGQQPFRSQPRIRVVGLDGLPVRPGSTPAEPGNTIAGHTAAGLILSLTDSPRAWPWATPLFFCSLTGVRAAITTVKEPLTRVRGAITTVKVPLTGVKGAITTVKVPLTRVRPPSPR